MSMEWMTEILSAHAEQLKRGAGTAAGEPAGAVRQERAELQALMRTAARAQSVLAPVTMPAAFRARLHDGLTMAARHRESQKMILGRRDPAWGWVIGAAALGSAAGLIAIAWRARHPHRSGDAARSASQAEDAKRAHPSRSLAGKAS